MKKKPIPEDKLFGMRLREQRKKLQVTQAALSEKTGVSVQYIGDIERGQANPTCSCMIKLARVLDISMASLFTPYCTSAQEISLMKKNIIAFIKNAKLKQVEMFYALYKGLV